MSPAILITLLAGNLGIATDWENLGWLVAFGVLSNFVFTGQGYCIGVLILDENKPLMVNAAFVMLFVTTNGVLCNLTTASWFVRGISNISPTRLNCEGFLRVFSTQIPDLQRLLPAGSPIPISQEAVLNNLGYTWGLHKCLAGLGAWLVGWMVLALIGINLKFRSF